MLKRHVSQEKKQQPAITTITLMPHTEDPQDDLVSTHDIMSWVMDCDLDSHQRKITSL